MNTPKEPSVLDSWALEAKKDIEWWGEKYFSEPLLPERILSLIDLVRKKDKALEWTLENVKLSATKIPDDLGSQCIWKALALTEELK